MSLLSDARAMHPELIELRHALHREPEIGLDLPLTQQKVLDALDGLPLEISTGEGTTSVTAVLRGSGPKSEGSGQGSDAGETRAVLLRGDMDGLPVQEQTGVEFSSTIDGAMHACGHDLHTTMLVGAARLLCDHRDELAGDVVFMFQPGEEGWDGAGVMIEEGVLDAAGPRVCAAYGLHVFSATQRQGVFMTKPGPMLSGSDELHVTVRGSGGHGASPYLALDPVPVVAEMVTALQTMVTRRFNIFDPVLVTVGLLQAGTKANVIPGEARFEATVRTYSDDSRQVMMEIAPKLIRGIADAHGLSADVDYVSQYPVTVNDETETAFAAETIAALLGNDRQLDIADPWAASEDFSRVLAEVPGSFVFLGAVPTGADPATAAFNHSPYAAFDDAVLADGAAVYAQLALRRLDRRD